MSHPEKPEKQQSQIIKPDSCHQKPYYGITVFLAGSIEMGSAENWQPKVENALLEKLITIYNPRREDWDSTWEQRQTSEQFNHQVNWEMNKIEDSDLVLMHFDKNTKSPITLLELGSLLKSTKLIVSCPAEFYRRGNVEIVCARHNIPIFYELDEAIGCLETKLRVLKDRKLF